MKRIEIGTTDSEEFTNHLLDEKFVPGKHKESLKPHSGDRLPE